MIKVSLSLFLPTLKTSQSARKKKKRILKCIIKRKISPSIFPFQKIFLLHCPVYPLLSKAFVNNKCHCGSKNKNGKY